MGHWDWPIWPFYQSINSQIGTPGGPKKAIMGSYWSLLNILGPILGSKFGYLCILKWSEWSLLIPHTLFQPHFILFQPFFGQQRTFISHIDSFWPILGGDLLKAVLWSKSDIFWFFQPNATQIVFFVRVLTPQWRKSGEVSLFFLIGLENWGFRYWCHTLTFGFLGHKGA